MPAETVRLRIGNLAKAVLVSGQAYQDPKDALNEFVSNAADEYVQAGRRGERIRIVLRRRGRAPVIAVDDAGRGMSPDRLREVARSLFESQKAGDDRTVGEKAIGILAFQQLGGRCDIVSRATDGAETWALRLERGKATAKLERERRKARQTPGTTIYLHDLEPDVLRVLTRRKVVDYLRVRRGPALARGDYEIEIVEGRTSEVVTPEQPDGLKLEIPPRPTLWGRIEFALYVAPPDGKRRRVAVVGRGGATIIDDIAEVEEFDDQPWTSDQVSGQIVFEALQPTAGRRAILRDREAFPVFVDAVGSVHAAVMRTLERVTRQVDVTTAERMSETLRRIFGRVLRELADLDNPMRTPIGDEAGEGGILVSADSTHATEPRTRGPVEAPDVPELAGPDPGQLVSDTHPESAKPDRSRMSALPSIAPDPSPREVRSRFDEEARIVLYNDRHADYLQVKEDEAGLLDYLATLIAKEYVVYNNPRAGAADLAEEMVRVLVRVRRHLPRRR
jgi:Histidine kinase-, DNA gyrase B-, and HSP90-like ATPase